MINNNLRKLYIKVVRFKLVIFPNFEELLWMKMK